MSARKITRENILDTDIYCLTAHKFSNGRSNIDVIKDMLDNDIKLIQYREKEMKSGLKYKECCEIRKMTREAGAAFIINDDIDLAMMVEADGIHIGQEDFPVEVVRKLIGDKMAIGLSTHNPEQAQKALSLGVDYIGVGPMYRTFTKEDVCDPVGFDYLDYVIKNIDLPVVAIGGIKEHNVGEVTAHGVKCVALVTEIVGAENIGAKISDIRAAMQK